MKVGIIGGTGKMGTFFGNVFSRAGHDVMVSGRSTKTRDVDIANQCDIVMVSVPIRETVRVIRQVAPLLSEEQVFCDLTSLKAAPVRAMLESRARVVGLHPMFGPSAESLHRQTIIATPARCDEETLGNLLEIFRSQGARVTITTPEEHDRMMAVVQGLTHYVTLGMAGTMRRLGMSPEDTMAFMSPIYQIEMCLVGRLLSQDPDLYADILMLNPEVPAVLSACNESFADLHGIVTKGDADEFRRFFLENSRHFGDYCARAAGESDMLISAMVRR
ncbi:MAG TPA: prephenate dehydrogenase/arogenate dehydrogenase family protein [Methanolinea sp.]|nr:prephenate dehydrogenase/arogenate dehydrogenase family protein [Methanolinea sp.]HRS92332.1 prephenate dehydrogenase/arogenate dehydrogenase family protein [Methanolinea sp.]HRU79078.1 prephenate dehydrogenase/arogenate dehydrogenase family protein [Methanolinea sp.]